MGEWNETCAFSRLPIQGGDKVMWMLLVQSRYLYEQDGRLNAGVYPDAFWVPRNLPVVGEYDTYGGIENVETGIVQEMALDMLRLDMVDKGRTSRMRIIGIPTPTRKNLTFDRLQGWLHEGCVRVDNNTVERIEAVKHMTVDRQIDELVRKSSKQKRDTDKKLFSGVSKMWRRAARLPVVPVPVIRIMILKEVWDYLCEMPPCREMFGNISFNTIRQHVGEFVDDLVRQREGRKQETKTLLDGLNKIHPVHDDALELGVIDLEKAKKNPGLEELKRSFYYLGCSGGPYSMSVGRQMEIAYEWVRDGTISEQDATTVFHRAIDFAAVSSHINELRITWAPQTGEGSQTSALDSHMRFAKFVAKQSYRTERASLIKRLEWKTEYRDKAKTKDRERCDEDIDTLEAEIRLLDADYSGKKLRRPGMGRTR